MTKSNGCFVMEIYQYPFKRSSTVIKFAFATVSTFESISVSYTHLDVYKRQALGDIIHQLAGIRHFANKFNRTLYNVKAE